MKKNLKAGSILQVSSASIPNIPGSIIPVGINKTVITKIRCQLVVEFWRRLMRRDNETTGWN